RPRERGPGGAQAPTPRGAERGDSDRAQARMDPHQGEDGSGVHGTPLAREERGAAHRMPGGGLPQHLRMLGGPRGDIPDRRLTVHTPLRLLPDRHREAGGLRHRRTTAGRRERATDGPAVCDGHQRRARRSPRHGGVAERRDRPQDPRAQPEHRRGATRERAQRGPRLPRPDLRRGSGGLRAQRRDGPADLQADSAGVPIRAIARCDLPGQDRRAH
ncbi:hypothetical protein ABE10_00420, partial [Bacillus toyonensis]|nr:hypothetical protein [Bacillus toyonensis]